MLAPRDPRLQQYRSGFRARPLPCTVLTYLLVAWCVCLDVPGSLFANELPLGCWTSGAWCIPPRSYAQIQILRPWGPSALLQRFKACAEFGCVLSLPVLASLSPSLPPVALFFVNSPRDPSVTRRTSRHPTQNQLAKMNWLMLHRQKSRAYSPELRFTSSV